MSKLAKLFKHLRKGTIPRRIAFEKNKKLAINKDKEWQAFLTSNQEFTQQNLFDSFQLKLYKDSSLSKSLFRGDFEFMEIKFIQSFLRAGDVFVDIGANIGYFSIPASQTVGDSGKVYSFEPTDTTYKRLEESIALNKRENITPFKIALSDKSEQREFVISNDGFDAYNSLGKPSQGSDFSKNVVTTQAFDSFMKEKNIPTPTLMKIDVEGWEIPVINGMKDLLSKEDAPLLMVEFTEDNAQLSGFSCADLFSLISDFGYSLYEYNWVRNEMVKQQNKDYFSYTNLIAFKNDSIVKERLNNISIL